MLSVDDKSTYIDVVFRNGLKDLEVLPPNDVWENVQPAIHGNKRSVILFRVAAFAAILLSVGLIAYLLTNEISDSIPGAAISPNQDVGPEGAYIAEKRPVPVVDKEIPDNLVKIKETIISGVIDLDNTDAGNLPVIGSESQAVSKNIMLFTIFNRTLSGSLIANSNNRKDLNLDKLSGKYPYLKAENLKNKWSLSAMGSPTYYSGNITKANAVLNNLMASEKSLISYSGGLAISFSFNKKFRIQSGIYYSSVGQKVTGISSYSGFTKFNNAKSGSNFGIQTSRGTIVSTNSDIYFNDLISNRVFTNYSMNEFDPYKTNLQYLNNSIYQDFNYLEVPVTVIYKIIDKKIDFNLTGGISYNLLVNNSVYTSLDNTRYYIGKTRGLNTLTLSSLLGMGIEYNLSEKLSLNLEPTFRYYISPFGVALGNKIHPYSFGLFSGFSYKF